MISVGRTFPSFTPSLSLIVITCRKQVETYSNGGNITERRLAWSEALSKINPPASLARKMMVCLGATAE